jgi:hypothetical protein
MDDRRSVIKELEEKKRTLAESRNRLLQGLGETLIQRIGEGEPFPDSQADGSGGPGAVLAEYRRMKKEIAESDSAIKSLELDIIRLKEIEERISAIEGEQSLLKGELAPVQVRIGMAVLNAPDSSNNAALLKNQEEALLAKIGEHEKALEELEEQGGGILGWLGKNARTAVEKALLSKGRSDLEKLYLRAGVDYLSTAMTEPLSDDAVKDVEKAVALKERITSLSEELLSLKEERRKLGGYFGTDISPANRIKGFEKRIAQITKEFSGVYFRLGLLAAAGGGKETFASFMNEDDSAVLDKAEAISLQVAEEDRSIEKVNAAIRIDEEKAEIEKLKRAIIAQQQKIADAEDAIAGIEDQISETEQHIVELEIFIQGDHGSQN